jgi:prepilin-type N-terminal cleavage/methylation domain-containing protein
MTERGAHRGMTLIEVLAALLVLSVGFLAAIGVARYALRLSRESIGASLAVATARTVLADIRMQGPAILDLTTVGGVTSGYVNSLYVRRTVVDQAVRGADTFATVKVEVFWSGTGDRSVTLQERMVFHAVP